MINTFAPVKLKNDLIKISKDQHGKKFATHITHKKTVFALYKEYLQIIIKMKMEKWKLEYIYSIYTQRTGI